MSGFADHPGVDRIVDPLVDGLGDHEDGELYGIQRQLESFLEPGERLLAYAGCPCPDIRQLDVFSYTPGGPDKQTDAFDYARGEQLPQTDAFAYDMELGSRLPDVVGYEAGGRLEDNDAMAYPHSTPTPENDAFMRIASAGSSARFFLLTSRRLIRGKVDGDTLSLKQARIPALSSPWTPVPWASVH